MGLLMSPDAMGNSWSLFGFFRQVHALIKSLSLYLILFFIIKQFFNSYMYLYNDFRNEHTHEKKLRLHFCLGHTIRGGAWNSRKEVLSRSSQLIMSVR